MNSAKKKIRLIVEKYIKDFPEEFALFKDGMHMRKKLTRDQYATIEGSASRGLFEMPETLAQLFLMGLEEDEMIWFKAGGRNGHEGGRWFARTFSVFALPDSI